MRVAELGLVHRHEASGVMHGLFRVRQFTQDDAHIFCTPEQIEPEIIGVIELTFEIYRAFGFEDFHIELSTKPIKHIGSDEIWDISTNALKNALEHKKIEYKINEGDGAFYGPKIDFHIKDCLKRSWQLGTIQLDFSMPARFALVYTDKDAKSVQDKLKDAQLRCSCDLSNEKINAKIAKAHSEKLPYMLVVGPKEAQSDAVNVRIRSVKEKKIVEIDKFLRIAKHKIVYIYCPVRCWAGRD
jgi:threonyl-tRNA synthetase